MQNPSRFVRVPISFTNSLRFQCAHGKKSVFPLFNKYVWADCDMEREQRWKDGILQSFCLGSWRSTTFYVGWRKSFDQFRSFHNTNASLVLSTNITPICGISELWECVRFVFSLVWSHPFSSTNLPLWTSATFTARRAIRIKQYQRENKVEEHKLHLLFGVDIKHNSSLPPRLYWSITLRNCR